MKFHVEFSYNSESREKALRFLKGDGLKEGGLKVKGVWIAAQTGTGFAVVDTDDATALYALCSQWSDYGTLKVTPVIAGSEL
jgi:hypothetical protein